LSNPPSVVCAAAVAANACISTRNATSRRIASSFELLADETDSIDAHVASP
jgi:hypothetical protein